jgi:uncharacterized protein YbjT (DUF2867 family)
MTKILVLGATGKTGRRVVDRLSAKGVVPRRGSRSGSPRFDWDARETWDAAVEGIERVYLSYYPDVAAPAASGAIGAFVECAVSAGVQRLVMLSGRGEPQAAAIEQLVRGAGVEWTIVRSSFFAQNFSEGFFLGSLLDGELALPVGGVGEPFVDADDIADVATAALLDNRHSGELYEVTGPRLLTFEEAVAEIARAANRPIRFTHLSPADYAAALVANHVPQEYVSLVTYLLTEVCDGRNAWVGGGVQRALGREPRDFRDYVRAAAATWQTDGAPTLAHSL